MELVLEDAGRTMLDASRCFRIEIQRFRVAAGEAKGILGPSGSGKSTVLELIGLIAAPSVASRFHIDTGERRHDLLRLWKGRRERELSSLRACHFGFVLQTGGLFPFLTVRENVSICQRITGRLDHDWIGGLMDRLGLTEHANAHPARLSIGERQRVSIARALAHRPAFVIADEPTSALDPGNAERVLQLLLDCARETEAAVILSSHNQALLERHGVKSARIKSLGEMDPGVWVSRLEEVE